MAKFTVNITPLEKRVLAALFESADGNGHAFGFMEDCREAVDTPRELAGAMSSLVKKGIVEVHHDPFTMQQCGVTQITWVGYQEGGPDEKGVLSFVRDLLNK